MVGTGCFLLLLQVLCVAWGSWAQHSPYSLQAAVDELHRREAAKYPLNAPPSQQHYYGGALGTAAEQDYWDEDSVFPATNTNKNRNRHRLNKALAKYLERENSNADRGGLGLGPFGGYEFDEDSNSLFLPPEEKKRSSYFRERDNKYETQPSSVFRERESQALGGDAEHSELTEQFLREIEETQEREREERYKDALRNLWEKYQQQENEINDDLFEEKKRMRMPPYYMLMQKKRSYPVLPWLPYAAERKKRFPVAKRSTKRAANENSPLGKTDDKVAKELSELFGPATAATAAVAEEKKKKRSVEDQAKEASTNSPDVVATTITDTQLDKPKNKGNLTETATHTISTTDAAENGDHSQHAHEHEHAHHGHSQKEHKHHKRSEHHSSHESHEEEEESESEEHEPEEGEEEEEEDFEEEEEEQRKKKRDLGVAKHNNLELFRGSLVIPGELTNLRRKKSIEWSKYFGIDRKKKAVKKDRAPAAEMKKRSPVDEESNANEEEKKKRNLDPEKLDNMDRKLQSIEDFIIDETIKYTGAHEGIVNQDEIRRLKDHVLSRLATAYSLEKMRRALEKLRQSVETENHLLRNVIEPNGHLDDIDVDALEKRLSVKKEKAATHDMDNMGLSTSNDKTKEMHSNAMMSTTSDDNKNNDAADDEDEDVKKHKKKRNNSYLRYPELPNDFTDLEQELGAGRYETLNDAYLGNKNYIIGSNQCPLIESMAERCRGVDLLSGDINQELLPICGVHQICYLCGTSQVACDYQYLAEADAICGNNNDCEAAARSVLMILRGTPGPQLGPRECLKNPCLYSAMREIGL